MDWNRDDEERAQRAVDAGPGDWCRVEFPAVVTESEARYREERAYRREYGHWPPPRENDA